MRIFDFIGNLVSRRGCICKDVVDEEFNKSGPIMPEMYVWSELVFRVDQRYLQVFFHAAILVVSFVEIITQLALYNPFALTE